MQKKYYKGERYTIKLYDWWFNESTAEDLTPITEYGYTVEHDPDPDGNPWHDYYNLISHDEVVLAMDGENVYIDGMTDEYVEMHVSGSRNFKLSFDEASRYLLKVNL